jgi:hypothetical protein
MATISKQHALRAAIDTCLAGCYRDESPVLRLSECLDRLRLEGWSEADVRRIELSVLRLLVGLMSRDMQVDDDDTAID